MPPSACVVWHSDRLRRQRALHLDREGFATGRPCIFIGAERSVFCLPIKVSMSMLVRCSHYEVVGRFAHPGIHINSDCSLVEYCEMFLFRRS